MGTVQELKTENDRLMCSLLICQRVEGISWRWSHHHWRNFGENSKFPKSANPPANQTV